MTSAAAQQAIASDWITLGERLGVTTAPTSATTTSTPVTTPTSAQPPAVTVPLANYKAGEFCPKADIGLTVTTSEEPLTCKVTTSPDHQHWSTPDCRDWL
jgi:hypothetical protein